MQTFLDTYQSLTVDSLDRLASIYTEDIIFIDPAHQIHGLDRLTAYFAALYRNINTINFTFHRHLQTGDEGFVQWEMSFSHPRLNAGRIITVPGISCLRFNEEGKVSYHRDYFDLGAMIYENLPLVGRILTAVKRRLGS